MQELTEILKTAGPVGATSIIMVAIFLRYLKFLRGRLDLVTDEYIKALKDLVAENKDAMVNLVSEFKSRPCMMKLTVQDLKIIMDARESESKEMQLLRGREQ